MELDEIIRLSFLKYKLSGHKSMNSFIFAQAKKEKLSDTDIDKLLNTLDIKIQEYEEEKQKESWEKLNYTCNIKRFETKRKEVS